MELSTDSELSRSFDALNLTLKWKLLEPNLLIAESGMCLYVRVLVTTGVQLPENIKSVDLAGREQGPRFNFSTDPHRPSSVSLRIHIRVVPLETIRKHYSQPNTRLSPHNVVYCLKNNCLLMKSDMKDFIAPTEAITSTAPGSVVFARAQDCLIPEAPGVCVTLWCYRKIELEELRARINRPMTKPLPPSSDRSIKSGPKPRTSASPATTKISRPSMSTASSPESAMKKGVTGRPPSTTPTPPSVRANNNILITPRKSQNQQSPGSSPSTSRPQPPLKKRPRPPTNSPTSTRLPDNARGRPKKPSNIIHVHDDERGRLMNAKWMITTDLHADPKAFTRTRTLPGTDYPDFGDPALFGGDYAGEDIVLSVEEQAKLAPRRSAEYWRAVNSASLFNHSLFEERVEMKEWEAQSRVDEAKGTEQDVDVELDEDLELSD